MKVLYSREHWKTKMILALGNQKTHKNAGYLPVNKKKIVTNNYTEYKEKLTSRLITQHLQSQKRTTGVTRGNILLLVLIKY